jgi:penicillin-binding protein 1C
LTLPLLTRGTALALYQMMEQPLPNELDAAALGTAALTPRVCWKTGTSTGNHDAWSFVFNGQYVVGVWLGNPDGRSSRRLVGAEAALPLAGRIFRRLPTSAAPAWPEGGEDLVRVEVCAVSGLPRSGWCEHTRTALIPRRQYLGRLCDVHWPAPGAPLDAERPPVIERWPASARAWDLAHIGAPPAERRVAGAKSATVRALQILNPPSGAHFILTGEAQGDRIPLESSSDAQGPVHWYLNGKFLATAAPDHPAMLTLTPGNHRLVCMTPRGATAQARFIVAQPASANPEFK